MTTDKDIKKSWELINKELPKPKGALQNVRQINLAESIALALSEERQRVLDLVSPVSEYIVIETNGFEESTRYWKDQMLNGCNKRARALLEKLRGLG